MRHVPDSRTMQSEQRTPNELFNAALCAGMGAILMYLLDPDRGRRRRALMRDQLVHAGRTLNEGAKLTSRDVANRAQGLWAEGKSLLAAQPSSDETLIPRIRSALGRVVSHPHAIEVGVREGHVILGGPILAREVEALLACVRKVPGIRDIENRLVVYREAGNLSSLQGGRPRAGRRFELFQDNWSPTARLLAGMGSGALILSALRRPTRVNLVLGGGALALFARATTNRDLQTLLGVGDSARGIQVQKTVNVFAPVEDVFAFWTNCENFPRFMKNVLRVEAQEGNLSRWAVRGPAAVPIEWTAETTAVIPNELIEWRSVEGPVKHWGRVRFDVNEVGATRVSIELAYVPLGGALGHAIAKLFGRDPKSEMDADLMRMKSMIETGMPPHDAAQREQIARNAGMTEAAPF